LRPSRLRVTNSTSNCPLASVMTVSIASSATGYTGMSRAATKPFPGS